MERKKPAVKEAALAALSRREYSRKDLRHKLINKGFYTQEVDAVLVGLQKAGLLSEERFVESLIYNRSQKGYGPVRIHHELLRHDVEETLVEKFLDPKDARWLELALQVKIKRFGEILPKNRQEWAKQAQFLTYRGFTSDQVQKVLQQQFPLPRKSANIEG